MMTLRLYGLMGYRIFWSRNAHAERLHDTHEMAQIGLPTESAHARSTVRIRPLQTPPKRQIINARSHDAKPCIAKIPPSLPCSPSIPSVGQYLHEKTLPLRLVAPLFFFPMICIFDMLACGAFYPPIPVCFLAISLRSGLVIWIGMPSQSGG